MQKRWEGQKRIMICYVCIPTHHDECSHYVLQTYPNKNLKRMTSNVAEVFADALIRVLFLPSLFLLLASGSVQVQNRTFSPRCVYKWRQSSSELGKAGTREMTGVQHHAWLSKVLFCFILFFAFTLLSIMSLIFRVAMK